MKYPILLPNIFNHAFTYESNLKLEIGDYVTVPFGKSKYTGVVWDEFEKNDKKKFKIKKIISKLNISSLKKDTINFLNWLSKYNLVPKGMALKLVLLSSDGVEKLIEKKYNDYLADIKQNSFELSPDQKKSLRLMNKSKDRFRVHVLQGTTGSGKTIVYFEALKKIIIKGFQGLILLPEIGLTNQFEDNSSKLNLFEAAKHSHQPITADTRVMTNTTTSIGVNSVINSLNLYEAQFTSRLGMLLADQLSHGNENFELQLEPESFGKVRINVSLENSNVEIKMIAENSAAVLALRGGELMLQNIAEQHGLKLSDYSVGMQNNQDGQSSDQKGDLGRSGKEQKNRIEEVEQDLLSDSSDVKYKLNLLA